ncbi:hypothetical protein ANCCAN_16693 [Ancylostoma caninum]|uniref:Uncharacterized protein n=1 Tax=Ancylostoma caninum TaxID=29170 RepID=A0A368G466_ANCCA|nr:hypothetical protein ANCCAN_16693 [Ancylostoma caninum]
MSEEETKRTSGGARNIRRGSFTGRGNKHGFRGERRRFGHEFTYPTGGSKEDPLNLNAVMSGDESFTSEQAEKDGSKLLEVLVPKNIKDPLNLNGVEKQRKKRKHAEDSSVGEDEIVSPVQRKQKKSRHHGSPRKDTKESSANNADSTGDEASASGSKPTPAELRKIRQEHFNNSGPIFNKY